MISYSCAFNNGNFCCVLTFLIFLSVFFSYVSLASVQHLAFFHTNIFFYLEEFGLFLLIYFIQPFHQIGVTCKVIIFSLNKELANKLERDKVGDVGSPCTTKSNLGKTVQLVLTKKGVQKSFAR